MKRQTSEPTLKEKIEFIKERTGLAESDILELKEAEFVELYEKAVEYQSAKDWLYLHSILYKKS